MRVIDVCHEQDPATKTNDPRLKDWRERAGLRTEGAARSVSQLPGVIAVTVGGSVGRDENWPLSDIGLMVVSAQRQVGKVAADVGKVPAIGRFCRR